jgi:hypothetical protein
MDKHTFLTIDRKRAIFNYTTLMAMLVGLYLTSLMNYLLFHSLAEIFSIVVAFSLFMIAWTSKQYIKNPYLLFVGIAYLFIGGLDLLHTLSYKGMGIFTDYDFYANQLWIGARYMESITLLLAFAFLYTGKTVRTYRVIAGYTLVTAMLVASIFYIKVFPECFIAGVGLTPFKKISEYIICIFLALTIFLLVRNKKKFEPQVFQLLRWSLVCTIVSELAFTFYVSNYGFSNLVGHYFKLFSFFLIYQAIIRTGIERPVNLIFRELDKTNQQLTAEIDIRKKIEHAHEKLITKLEKALEEIKSLEGILPICMHCKKIRDDKGYWNQLEQYIHERSDAEFSHGICPECRAEHYPEYGKSDTKNPTDP